MREIVAADIGGTNARFARAVLGDDGIPQLGTVRKYRVADYPSLQACWRAFAADEPEPLPRAASIAFATVIKGEQIKMTNSPWMIRPASLAEELGLDCLRLVNDFEAVAHGVAHLPIEALPLLFGEDQPFPHNGSVTLVGPGTGLGVGLIAYDDGVPHVVPSEGGHLDFAPLDAVESQVVDFLRGQFLRVSTERIVSGPGLNNLYKALARRHHQPVSLLDDADLWAAALEGSNAHAREALERFCMAYGAVAGDLALAHGPYAVVLVGGLTQRLRDFLMTSGFHARFVAKGRFEGLMRSIPVRLATHAEIGLYGAAAAFRE